MQEWCGQREPRFAAENLSEEAEDNEVPLRVVNQEPYPSDAKHILLSITTRGLTAIPGSRPAKQQ